MPERSLLLAVLPWTALGLQAWWLCLLQSLGVWLSLKSRSRAALPLCLLLLALVAALLNLPDIRRAALIFVITGPLSLVLAAGTLGVQAGRRWALAFPAAVLLLGPSFVGALALLLGALGMGNPEAGSNGQALKPLPAASRWPLGWLLGAALLIAAFVALPRPDLPHLDRSPIDVVERVTAPSTNVAPRSNRATRPSTPTAARPPRPDHSLQTLLNAASLPLLGMLLLCLAILRRGWSRSALRPQSLVMVLTLVLLAAGLFVMGLLLQPQALYRVVGQIVTRAEPEPSAGKGAGATPPPTVPLALPDWLIWSVAVLGLLLLAGAAWFVLNLKEPPEDQEASEEPPVPVLPASAPPGRVRAAYAATLKVLAGQGLSRAEHETPDEFLRRVAARWPNLATALAHLTGAYRLVRYGGAVDEHHAGAAERAAADVQAALTHHSDSSSESSERQP